MLCPKAVLDAPYQVIGLEDEQQLARNRVEDLRDFPKEVLCILLQPVGL